jgi:hypothetical protein
MTQAFERTRNIGTTGPDRTSLALGFTAGFLSVWIFSSGMIALLYVAGVAVPFAPWSMAPTAPFGVPQTLSGAFWGGLWGLLYSLLEPRLTARVGWWAGGLLFGALPLFVLWFVVLPVKGIPVGGGFALSGSAVGVALHTIFGFGTAILFRTGARLVGRGTSLAPKALTDGSRV